MYDESANERNRWHKRTLAANGNDPCMGPLILAQPMQDIVSINRKVDFTFPPPDGNANANERRSRKDEERSLFFMEFTENHRRYLQGRIDNLVPILAGLLLQTDQPVEAAQRFFDQIEAFLNLASCQTAFGFEGDFGMGKGSSNKKQRKK